MKINLNIGTSDSDTIIEIIGNIKNSYPMMEVINEQINTDESLSTITVEVEDKDAFIKVIENGMENYDFDPLSSVTDLDEFELWSDSIF
jgi:2-hydroxy-3-keto-5-methylthiopentenyl-1-phosphate phosphatase